MIRALQAFVLAALLLAPSLAVADGSVLKLRVFSRGAGAPPSSGLLPGASPPANEGQSTWTATSVPGAQGTPGAYGYDYGPVASWNVPQFHTVAVPFNIGVVAFKAPSDAEYTAGVTSNIDYVDFACDGGSAVRVETMALNSNSGTVEFFVEIDPADFTDGLHECRATVVPTTGVGKVLQGNKSSTSGELSASLYINTNAGGTLTKYTKYVTTSGVNDAGCGDTVGDACLTISYAKERIRDLTTDLGGSTICVGPGTFQYGATTESNARTGINQYLVIDSCAPGGSKAATILIPGTGGLLKVSKVKIQNVTWSMAGSINGGGIGGGATTIGPMIWAHNVAWEGPGRFVRNANPFVDDSFPGGKYLTDVSITNMLHATGGNLLRNATISNLGSDAVSNTKLIINTDLSDVNRKTFATANATASSNVLTNVSNFTDIQVGSYIGNMCGWPASFATYATAIDTGAQTITMADACPSGGTGLTINTATHADAWQGDCCTTLDNVIMYGFTANTNFDGQAFFIGSNSSRTRTNYALVDVSLNNRPPGGEGLALVQIGTDFINALFLNGAFTGSWDFSDVNFAPVSVSFVNSSCASGSPGPKTGVTYRNSATCD